MEGPLSDFLQHTEQQKGKSIMGLNTEGIVVKFQDGTRLKLINPLYKIAARAQLRVHPYYVWNEMRMGRYPEEKPLIGENHREQLHLIMQVLTHEYQDLLSRVCEIGSQIPFVDSGVTEVTWALSPSEELDLSTLLGYESAKPPEESAAIILSLISSYITRSQAEIFFGRLLFTITTYDDSTVLLCLWDIIISQRNEIDLPLVFSHFFEEYDHSETKGSTRSTGHIVTLGILFGYVDAALVTTKYPEIECETKDFLFDIPPAQSYCPFAVFSPFSEFLLVISQTTEDPYYFDTPWIERYQCSLRMAIMDWIMPLPPYPQFRNNLVPSYKQNFSKGWDLPVYIEPMYDFLLSDECLTCVFSFLKLKFLVQTRLVCSAWKHVVDANEWRLHFRRDRIIKLQKISEKSALAQAFTFPYTGSDDESDGSDYGLRSDYFYGYNYGSP